MKKWNTPAVEEIAINETAHRWTGIYRDGGYIGDGEISGHLSWDKNDQPGCNPSPAPTPTATPTATPTGCPNSLS